MASIFSVTLARPRHLLKFFESGVQTRLHGSDRNLENFGNFTVLEVLVIRQDQGLTKSIGKPSNAFPNPLLPLGFLKLRQRPRIAVDQQVDQVAGIGFTLGRVDALIKADGRVPARLPEGINGLMGSDRVKLKGLKVVKIFPDKNYILISGSVPGHNGSIVLIQK